jgi:hypothetical protein
MANLTVTISENLQLNGSEKGSTNTASISNITQCSNEIKTCPGETAETYLGNFASRVDASNYSNYNYANAKYVRVTNLDSEYGIEVAFASTSIDDICGSVEVADSYRVYLRAGQSSILWDSRSGKLGASTLPDWTRNLSNLSYVSVKNATAHNIDVEFFVASELPEEPEAE